jgi:hypothetical protein
VPRRLTVAVLALVTGASLTACNGQSSSDASSSRSSPSAPSSSAATDEPTASGTGSAGANDPASTALCAAVTNAVGAGVTWKLGAPVPQTRVVSGVPVAACDVTQAAGAPDSRLSVAYLPVGGSLDGAGLLAGLCQAVIGVQAQSGDRSCAGKATKKPGAELGRADLITGDGGVLVLSFTSSDTAYAKTAAADLGKVGQALAADPLLARALG